MDSSNPPTNEIPRDAPLKRSKIGWRVLLIFNFALGAYMFAQAGKKERTKEKTDVPPAEVPPTPTETTVPVIEEPAFSPPPLPVIVRQPVPEDQQRELLQWMLDEKRKVKPQNREEKKRIDEEKAILKEFIRSKSIPSF